ncbi:hypothetical protein ACHAXS_001782 [Conticribra weissflogii]
MGLGIENKRHPSDYVGVNINHFMDRSYGFNKQALIEAILDDIGMASSFEIKHVPMSSSKNLHSNVNCIPFFEAGFGFDYHSVIGKPNYLDQTSKPEIIFAMHQLARYSTDPRKEHGLAVD